MGRTMPSMYNLQEIYSRILKTGISDKKIKSKTTNPYGKIAVANSKKQMIYNKGYTVSSVETLMSNSNVATHFTPNVYHWLSRKNNTISGHEEKNLKQINTFVIDFDTSDIEYIDILNAGLNLEVMPTMILKTDKGFHAYFILENPVYISKKTKYKSLNVAKKISRNLRMAFNEEIEGVDLNCNHFGYFRCPNKHNVLFYQKDLEHTFKDLMAWSKRKSDDARAHLKVVVDNTFNTQHKQIEEAWYRELVQQHHIHGGEDCGRDNTIFTLSLANYQSGITFELCLNKMNQFNSMLETPLKNKEVEKTVNSAYSGRYKGASREYIERIMNSWVNKKYKSRAFNHWCKHKKSRQDRKYSHAEEREKDLIEYINTHACNGVVTISLRSLAAEFNISVTALKNVLEKSNKIKRKIVGKCRYTVTEFYTVQTLVQHVQKLKTRSQLFVKDINETFKLTPKKYQKVIENILEMNKGKTTRSRIEQIRLLI